MKTVLFRPFEKYSEITLLISGIIFTLIGSYIAYSFNLKFDGAIDIHTSEVKISFKTSIIDNLINILSLFIFLFAAAKYVNKKTRLIDILVTVLISRVPFYIVPFINLNGAVSKAGNEVINYMKQGITGELSIPGITMLFIFGIFTLLCLVWYIALLYNGYKISSNAKGKTAVFLFILALLFAEILSKILIWKFN